MSDIAREIWERDDHDAPDTCALSRTAVRSGRLLHVLDMDAVAEGTIKMRAPRRGREVEAPAARAREDSGQVIADAIRAVEQGSEAEQALVKVLNLREAERSRAVPLVTAAWVKRTAALIVLAVSIVAPAVHQLAGSIAVVFGPQSDDSAKLDAVLEQNTETGEIVLALVKWSIDCEVARREGREMPDVPAVLRLVVARDEVQSQ